ncbi:MULTISPECIES: hypothetical protein [unclassified Burkholderia]|nr:MULTISPECIES: hypothetical protein [unclassified Burkholderia]
MSRIEGFLKGSAAAKPGTMPHATRAARRDGILNGIVGRVERRTLR